MVIGETYPSCSSLPNNAGGDGEEKSGGNFSLGITTSTMKLTPLSTTQKNKIDTIWNSANEGIVITDRNNIQLTSADYKMLMPGEMIGSIELLPDIFQWIAPFSNPNAVVNTGRTGVGLTGGRNLQTRYFLRTRPVQPAPICPWCGEVGNHQRMRRNLRSTELGNEGFGYTDLTQE